MECHFIRDGVRAGRVDGRWLPEVLDNDEIGPVLLERTAITAPGEVEAAMRRGNPAARRPGGLVRG
jgi:hypothetical protein